MLRPGLTTTSAPRAEGVRVAAGAVAERGERGLVRAEVRDGVLDEVAREVHRALCRIPALVHDDRDKVASARMLRVRRDILHERVRKPRAHIYGNAPLPRQ